MANDLFSEHEIGLPLLLAGVGRFGGPVIGPLIGGKSACVVHGIEFCPDSLVGYFSLAGFIQERAGWRWLGFVITIFSGFLTLVALMVHLQPLDLLAINRPS
jgi:MFS family permease